MKILINQLEQMQSHFSDYTKENQQISKSNVGWHLEHLLLVNLNVILATKKSNPEEYKYSFSFPKLLIFTLGKIPRGKAKSPKAVTPTEKTTIQNLESIYQKAFEEIKKMDSINKDQFFEHPFFKKLKKKEMLTFLKIHNKHHLKIIHDILKK